MATYVDALGFVAAAIVFAVGVLSARLHSTFDVLVRQTADLSWAARVRIMEGRRVTPTDVDELTSSIASDADPMADASLALSAVLLVVGLAICTFGLLAPARSDDAPHAKVIVVLLFAACVLVAGIGVFDRLAVRARRAELTETATLSRLRTLGHECARGDRAAAATLESLRKDFPSWGLLQEIDALLCVQSGHPDKALTIIGSMLVAPRPDLYVAPVVAVAAAVGASGDAPALRLLDDVAQAEPALASVTPLRLALGLRLAHLDALLDDGTGGPPEQGGPAIDWARLRLAAIGEAQRRGPVRTGLDLEPGRLPATRRLMELAAAWWTAEQGLPDPGALRANSPLQRVVATILPHEETTAFSVDDDPRWDAGTLETMAMLDLLAADAGDARPQRALSRLERAARLSPAASRPQWWIAVVCRHLGWQDAAHRALDRSEILDDDDPLSDATRTWLAGERPGPVPDALLRDDVDRLRATLIGLAPALPGPPEDERAASLADRFRVALFLRAAARADAVPADTSVDA